MKKEGKEREKRRNGIKQSKAQESEKRGRERGHLEKQ